ncbi:MAG: hypothetical protein IT436_07795 [Phycisphaerales bacterium]|nr:hypothetical protein [Phycisphaerales bacterium]
MMTERTQLSTVTMMLLAASATALGQGIGGRYWLPATGGFGTDGTVLTAIAWDQDGDGPARPALYVGGGFDQAGGIPVGGIASWDGRGWSSLGGGMSGGAGWRCSLTIYPPVGLVAGGDFSSAGGQPGTARIAAWDGVAWSPLGWTGVGDVTDVTTFDPDGDGPQPPLLMAGTSADPIYAWDQITWHFLGPVFGFPEMISFDSDGDGPASPILLAGGSSWPFGVSGLIERWAGPFSEWWQLWGGGVFTGDGPLEPGAEVDAMTTWDRDGDGPASPVLVAAGAFNRAPGDVPANSIAIWDGVGWSALGDGLTEGPSGAGLALALTSFDPDDDGPQHPLLIVGGYFDRAGGVPVNNIAVWDGGSWSPLGGGLTSDGPYTLVRTLTTYDPDGPGPRPPWLVAGGDFELADGRASPYLALWGFCPADLTEDGLVDFSDYLEFLNAYEVRDLRVDYAGDGLVEFADYLEFLNRYEAGC